MTPAEIAGRLIEEPYREPDECGLCDGAGERLDPEDFPRVAS